jgi:ABC-type thiamine transport system ATPase subunit
MKTIMTALLISLASASALAQPINIPAGGSIQINGDTVNCQGPSQSSLPPACSIHQEQNVYHLYVGENVAETFYSFNSAVEGAKQMKDAGLCR